MGTPAQPEQSTSDWGRLRSGLEHAVTATAIWRNFTTWRPDLEPVIRG
ncbi:MAG: hypothetical protein GY711_01800 [bacterium]|nr:hypothetical protein [bacterium]